MRRFLFLLAPLGLATFSFACEDDPTGNPSANLPEAGTFDADRPDSSTPDAQPDSPVAPKGVTVVVTGRSGPKSGVTVVFHDASGAVLETKQTGSDGKATSAPSPTPAMATAVLGGDVNRQLITWTGTEDGDELPAVLPEPGTLAELEVTIPGEADGGTGLFSTYYASVGGCRSNGTNISNAPITLFVEGHCFRGAGALLVEARDSNDNSLAHSFKKPLTLPADGGVATVDGLPAYAFNPASVVVQITGPTNVIEGGFARLYEVANNTYFPSQDRGFVGSTANATVYEKTFKIAPAAFTEAISASVAFEGTNTLIVGKRTAVAATVTLDANALPPAITGALLNQTNPKRPIANWTGMMTGMRGGVVRLRLFDSANDKATSWSIVVPATSPNEVIAPSLPAALDNLLPAADSGVQWDTYPEIIFADSTLLVAGYATFRKVQGVVLPAVDNDATVEETVLPANGDFKITRWYQSLGR